MIAKIQAKDLDTSAILRFRIDPESSEARTERGTLLKLVDHDFASTFRLDPTDGLLSVAKLLDREMIEMIKLGLVVEDIASVTGAQIATSEFISSFAYKTIRVLNYLEIVGTKYIF